MSKGSVVIAPAKAVAHRVRGKIRHYDCPDRAAVDHNLEQLQIKWIELELAQPAFAARVAPTYWHDIDLLLDKRLEL